MPELSFFALQHYSDIFHSKKTVQPSPTSPITSSASLSATPKDEIYIDDESIEGSGGRGGFTNNGCCCREISSYSRSCRPCFRGD
ncbi:unnamed protein product [Ceratitis capitata]|uniref:(Mediterranean fruit fly) hypothetical protein n=1 Tax=Ceratitis capitata TaxID=7213 RepID=A0A811VGL6_CERCA|nr:unnamed protein product [Ceratitis capitata]